MPLPTIPWPLGAFAAFAAASPLLASQPALPGEPMLVVGLPWAGPDAAIRAVLAEDGARIVRSEAGGRIAVALAGSRGGGAWPAALRIPLGQGIGCAGSGGRS